MDGRKNFAYTTLDGGINTTDNTNVPVVDASRLPAVPFNAAVYDGDNPEIEFDAGRLEFVRVTAKDTGTNTITFTRNTENGTNNSFASGARVDATITADTFDRVKTDIDNSTQSNINGATSATSADADLIAFLDSSDSNNLKKETKSNFLSGVGGIDAITKGVINDLVVSNAELRYRDNLSQLGYDGGFYDIFADQTKIASSSQVVISTLDGGATLGKVEIENQVTNTYDLGTASYNSEFKDIGTQESSPFGLAFNSDKTKMYVVGSGNDTVYAYDLSTAGDPSSGTYNSEFFDVSSQTATPTGVVLSSDDSKMYVMANSGAIYAYDLGTNGDVSTAVYNSETLDISAQGTDWYGIAFNSTEDKVYGCRGAGTIYAYDLGTAGDVSTGTYNSENFDTSTQSPGTLYAMEFNGDDTKMYIGGSNSVIYAYDLSTAGTVSSATYNSESLDVSTQDSLPRGIRWNNDGSKLYFVGGSNTDVFAYDVGTTGAYYSSGNFVSTTIDLSELSEAPNTVVLSTDITQPAGTDYSVQLSDGTNTVTINDTDVDTEVDCSALTTQSLTATVTLNADTVDDETPTLTSYALYFRV